MLPVFVDMSNSTRVSICRTAVLPFFIKESRLFIDFSVNIVLVVHCGIPAFWTIVAYYSLRIAADLQRPLPESQPMFCASFEILLFSVGSLTPAPHTVYKIFLYYVWLIFYADLKMSLGTPFWR